MSERCEPYITQDGYDSGQQFVCRIHTPLGEPVMRGSQQTYEVTLREFLGLVEAHWQRHYPDAGVPDLSSPPAVEAWLDE